MKNEKKLFLLDAYSLIFRAYYAFIKNPRINSSGLNTSAMLGFTNTLDDILKKEKPTHIAIAFDLPSPTFRREIYPQYKANRSPTPEDIIKAVPYIKEIVKGFNIPIYEMEGFEADDVIGTLAKQAEKKGFTVYMMTPDKDYVQLISENIFMYKPKKGGNSAEIVGLKEVKEKYKIENPEQFIDILTLWGDNVDNIPGVPGVGEKTAIKLISRFNSIDNLYRNLVKLKGKQKENIAKSKDLVKISKQLVTIDINVPVEYNEDECKIKDIDQNKLKGIFDELEFVALARRLFSEPKQETEAVKNSLFDFSETNTDSQISTFSTIKDIEHNYHYVDSGEKRLDLIELLNKTTEFCFDTETTGINPNESELVGISFSFKNHEAYYVPIPSVQTEALQIVSEFKDVFENSKIKKIGQNIKYDILMLKWYNVDVQGELFDTMIAHYLIHPDSRHNLTKLSESYLQYTPVSIEELIGKKGKQQRTMRTVSVEKIKDYACEDADITWQLKPLIEKELIDNNLHKLAMEVEMPLIYVLADMEKQGVKIDKNKLDKYSEELREKIVELQTEIHILAETEFNISSPKQLGEILFDRMKIIDNPKKTKTKQYSTGEAELVKLKNKHVIIEKILNFRSLKKLLTTYVNSLPKLINKRTDRIHTSFNQAVVTTGRLSSNNPNLQNIPIRTEDGRKIRTAFVPSVEDNVLLSADYSQIELRLMAHLSQDENMIEAFGEQKDIHSETAAKIFKVDINDVDRDMRAKAKSANFGIIYGISSFGLAQNLNIKRAEAKELIDGYFASYSKVKEYMNKCIDEARKKAYVSTIEGRKRYLRDINSRNHLLRSNAERNAINAPIQGSAADIIKKAMISIHAKIKSKYKSKMILQVHDELVFDVKKSELDDITKIVKQEMENAVDLTVKLTIEHGVGSNWLESH